jgi:hypothetical protein
MITKQLSQLCIVKNCFMFEARVYERLYNCKHKYRCMISEDDYDYVVDRGLRRRLDKVFKK